MPCVFVTCLIPWLVKTELHCNKCDIFLLQSMLTDHFFSPPDWQQRNPSPSLSDERDGNLSDIVLQNELKVTRGRHRWLCFHIQLNVFQSDTNFTGQKYRATYNQQAWDLAPHIKPHPTKTTPLTSVTSLTYWWVQHHKCMLHGQTLLNWQVLNFKLESGHKVLEKIKINNNDTFLSF